MPEMTGYDLLKAIKVVNLPPYSWLEKYNNPAILSAERNYTTWTNWQALSSPNPIPVVVMSSENEPQRISRWGTNEPMKPPQKKTLLFSPY
jgi:CheY-like chemotaxis protein